MITVKWTDARQPVMRAREFRDFHDAMHLYAQITLAEDPREVQMIGPDGTLLYYHARIGREPALGRKNGSIH